MASLGSDPWRRGARSLIQVAFVQAAIQLYQAFAAVPLTLEQVAAITTVATPLVATIQNLLEEQGAPALLKSPASGSEQPR